MAFCYLKSGGKSMKKTLLMILLCIVINNFAYAQIEKGDSEINFLGYYASMVGTDYDSHFGNIQFTYGHFVTKTLQIGIGPSISFTTWNDKTETDLSAVAFFNVNFTTGLKSVPYITGQWYQMDFDPEDADFTDASFINVGLGLKSFFTEYLALTNSITYGFSLAEDAEGGLLMFMSGLSFFF